MRKLVGGVATTLAVGLLIGAPALPASAQYPPQDVICGVVDGTLDPGEQVVVTGQGWEPGSVVEFVLKPPPAGIPLGSTKVDADGTFSAPLTIPDGIGPGPHTIECRGADVFGQPITPINVIDIVGGGSETAFTGPSGMSVPLWTILAVGLFLAGAILLFFGRRRARRGVGDGS